MEQTVSATLVLGCYLATLGDTVVLLAALCNTMVGVWCSGVTSSSDVTSDTILLVVLSVEVL